MGSLCFCEQIRTDKLPYFVFDSLGNISSRFSLIVQTCPWKLFLYVLILRAFYDLFFTVVFTEVHAVICFLLVNVSIMSYKGSLFSLHLLSCFLPSLNNLQ